MLNLIHWIVNFRHEAGFQINRPYGNNMYTIMLFKGSLQIQQDGRMVTIPPNSCIVYEPFAPQLYYNNSQDYCHDGVFFDGEKPFKLLQELQIPVNHAFAVKNPPEIVGGIQRITEEAIGNHRYSAEIIDLRIRDLIFTLASNLRGESRNSTRYYQQLAQLRHRILSHPEEEWDIQDIASSLHISVSYLQHLYQEHFRISPRQEIIHSRLARAENLLYRGDKSIAEIAELCGYSNSEHFIRQFKKYRGKPPKAYLKSLSQDQEYGG